MLVLSRKRNEQLVVGDGIVVTIIDIRGDKVRLGIEAPPNVPVHRKEVYEILKAQEAAERASDRAASEAPPPASMEHD